MLMTDPAWYYREQIEFELDRLGATTWRYQDRRGEFVDELKAAPAEVELRSDVYGAVLGQATAFVETLSRLHDGAGDDGVAEALLRRTPPPRL
jgi:hypothetical protein